MTIGNGLLISSGSSDQPETVLAISHISMVNFRGHENKIDLRLDDGKIVPMVFENSEGARQGFEDLVKEMEKIHSGCYKGFKETPIKP